MIPCGSSESGMCCRTISASTATGRLKSRVRDASSTTAVTSRASPLMNAVQPSGVLVSRARAWARTIGSLSTYTMRASGVTACATSCVFSMAGSPVPMSRNCRTPASLAR